MVECLPSVNEAPGSIPITTTRKKEKERKTKLGKQAILYGYLDGKHIFPWSLLCDYIKRTQKRWKVKHQGSKQTLSVYLPILHIPEELWLSRENRRANKRNGHSHFLLVFSQPSVAGSKEDFPSTAHNLA